MCVCVCVWCVCVTQDGACSANKRKRLCLWQYLRERAKSEVSALGASLESALGASIESCIVYFISFTNRFTLGYIKPLNLFSSVLTVASVQGLTSFVHRLSLCPVPVSLSPPVSVTLFQLFS
jgi:hypothetical protein